MSADHFVRILGEVFAEPFVIYAAAGDAGHGKESFAEGWRASFGCPLDRLDYCHGGVLKDGRPLGEDFLQVFFFRV